MGGASAASAADEFTYTPAPPPPICGDGTVDPPGEQCDDGAANGTPGDCCSITCEFQAAGTDCTDDGSLCTADVCDGAGTCAHPAGPSIGCTPPDVTAGASLVMRTPTAALNQAQFQWSNGPVVPLSDFGNPAGGDLYQLCVYDQTGPDTYTLVLSGSPSSSGGGTWTPMPLPQPSSVVAQLKTSLGTCWEATFSTPKVSTATEFKAKSD